MRASATKRTICGLLVLLVLLAACTPSPQPTATPLPTFTLAPTLRPQPTAAPLPTYTLAPTLRPQPTAAPLPTFTLAPTPAPPTPTTGAAGVVGKGELGITQADIRGLVEQLDPAFRFTFQDLEDPSGIPAVLGTAATDKARLKIMGPAEKPVRVALTVLAPSGDTEAQVLAGFYMAMVLQLATPDWETGDEWFHQAIDVIEEKEEVTTLANGIRVTLRIHPSFGPVFFLLIEAAGTEVTVGATTTDEEWDFLPLMPGLIKGLRAGPAGIPTYVYSVDASLEEIEAYYRQEMQARGWMLVQRNYSEQGGAMGGPALGLNFARADEASTLLAVRRKDQGEAVMTLIYGREQAEPINADPVT